CHCAEHAGRGEPDFGALPRTERTEGRHGARAVRYWPNPRIHYVTRDREGQLRGLPMDRCAAARCARLLRLGCERRADLERHDEAQRVFNRKHRKGLECLCRRAILRKVFQAPLRQISGYPGSNEYRLAVERGEIEGSCPSWSAIPQDWIVNH